MLKFLLLIFFLNVHHHLFLHESLYQPMHVQMGFRTGSIALYLVEFGLGFLILLGLVKYLKRPLNSANAEI
jgi:hypothetical protein